MNQKVRTVDAPFAKTLASFRGRFLFFKRRDASVRHLLARFERRSIYFVATKYTSRCLDQLYATAYNRVEGEILALSAKKI